MRSLKCCYQILVRSYQTHRGEVQPQIVPARDWKSDCLEKQGLLVGEIYVVLGRLHSNQGLAQSNNKCRVE